MVWQCWRRSGTQREHIAKNTEAQIDHGNFLSYFLKDTGKLWFGSVGADLELNVSLYRKILSRRSTTGNLCHIF